MTSDIALSGVACTSGVTPRQLVQSSSENDTCEFLDMMYRNLILFMNSMRLDGIYVGKACWIHSRLNGRSE